jgi:hypothetical protein
VLLWPAQSAEAGGDLRVREAGLRLRRVVTPLVDQPQLPITSHAQDERSGRVGRAVVQADAQEALHPRQLVPGDDVKSLVPHVEDRALGRDPLALDEPAVPEASELGRHCVDVRLRQAGVVGEDEVHDHPTDLLGTVEEPALQPVRRVVGVGRADSCAPGTDMRPRSWVKNPSGMTVTSSTYAPATVRPRMHLLRLDVRGAQTYTVRPRTEAVGRRRCSARGSRDLARTGPGRSGARTRCARLESRVRPMTTRAPPRGCDGDEHQPPHEGGDRLPGPDLTRARCSPVGTRPASTRPAWATAACPAANASRGGQVCGIVAWWWVVRQGSGRCRAHGRGHPGGTSARGPAPVSCVEILRDRSMAAPAAWISFSWSVGVGWSTSFSA